MRKSSSFKRTRPDGCVLAAIGAGEPFAIDMPGREQEECFPPALRQQVRQPWAADRQARRAARRRPRERATGGA